MMIHRRYTSDMRGVCVVLAIIASYVLVVEGCIYNNVTRTCFSDGINTIGEKVSAKDIVTTNVYTTHKYVAPQDVLNQDTLPQCDSSTISRLHRRGTSTYVLWSNHHEFDGAIQAVSNWQQVGSNGGTVAQGIWITHEYSVSGSVSVDLVISQLGISASYTYGETTTTEYALNLDAYSEGRLTFKPRLVKIRGRVRHSVVAIHCNSSWEEDFEIITQVLDQNKKASGVFSVEYRGTNIYGHQDFHMIYDKDMQSNDAGEHYGVKSPYYCGELVIRHEKDIAVYRPEYMGCWLKDVKWGHGAMHTSKGHFIGTYDVDHHDRDNTWSEDRVTWWKNNNHCDIIYREPNGHYWCKSYKYVQHAALMFHYNS